MNKATRQLILELMAEHNVMTLATVRPDGWPQATTVAYANDGLTLYFACGPDSQKVANIHQCDKVSATIDRDNPDWNAIRGLSLGGSAEVLGDEEQVARAGRLLRAKFPEWAQMPEEEAGEIAFVKVTPKVISVLDYTRGFGHTELVEVTGKDLGSGDR